MASTSELWLMLVNVALRTALIKLLWWLCEMGPWTGVGPLPWTTALFLSAFAAGGAIVRQRDD